jgi:hypothetical protein
MVSLVFNVPLSFFARKMSACIFPWPPCLQQWLFWNFIFKLAASGYSVLWNPPQDPSSPSLILLVDGEPCFQCPTVFFCKKMSACIFPWPPCMQQWLFWIFIFKLAASGYSVLWNPPQDPSSPSLILLVDGEPCFQCPTVFFCKKNECLHFSLAPLFTAMIILKFYLQTCRLWLFCTLKSSSRPFLPIFDSFSRWWALFSMSHCLFLQENECLHFSLAPPVCSNDYSEFLSSNLPPLVILYFKILLKTLPPHLWFF